MQILVSNDDGYTAPGIIALVDVLKQQAQITVVAPDRNRSGASNSLTLDSPLRAHLAENGFYRVDGTPTDCVHLGITGLLHKAPDMVVSGINAGGNMGDDVLYSGTVAAATEGRFLGLPAVAISLVGQEPQHYDSAAKVAMQLVENIALSALPSDTILNVNVPDIPYHEIRGFQATRLGRRHKSEPVVEDTDPRGQRLYWVGPVGPEQDAGPGTDFHAVRHQWVSVTPMKIDLTDYRAIEGLGKWLEEGQV